MVQERRVSERHVMKLPIRYREMQADSDHVKNEAALGFKRSRMSNISEGGLLFSASKAYSLGTQLELTFPIKDKLLTLKARVVHATQDPNSGQYNTGVCFSNPSQVFKIKMAEQLFLINQYRIALSRDKGEPISEEEAARKWIGEHSRRFAAFFI